jgi:superfamily II DNA or RNA helicase
MEFLSELHGTAIAKRGRTYASDGRVLNIHLEAPDCIVADVEGSEEVPYTVYLKIEEDYISSDCTCPYAVDCKHGYAVALVILGEANRRRAPWAREAASLFLPPAWLKGEPSALAQLAKDLDGLFGKEDAEPSEEPARKDRTAAAPKSEDWWREYLEAPTLYAQQEILRKALKPLVPPQWGRWSIEEMVSRTTSYDSPFDRLRCVEQGLTSFVQKFGKKAVQPGPGLGVFLMSDEARALEEDYLRKKSEQALLQWLAPVAGHSEADRSYVEVLWTIAPPRQYRVMPQLGFRVLLTTKKLRQSPRTLQSLEQLWREVDGGRRLVDPMEARLLRWLSRTQQLTSSHSVVSQNDPTLIPIRNAVEWITLWGASDLLKWEDGGPMVFDSAPARLTIDRRDGRAEWAVAYPGEDEVVPLRESTICVDRGISDSYYYREDENRRVFVRRGDVLRLLETGDMPDSVLGGAMRMPEVPLKLLQGTPEGARLVRRLAPKGEAADLVAEMPVRPIVECRLDGSTVRIAAHAEGLDGASFVWTHMGAWEYHGKRGQAAEGLEQLSENAEADLAPAQNAERALAFVPRVQDVEAVNAWLARAAKEAKYLTASDGGGMLEWRVKGANLYTLLEIWSERPQGATYLGDRAFRSLVTPSNAPAVRVQTEPSGTEWLKVSVEMEKEIDALSMEDILAALKASQDELVYLSGGRLYRREDLEGFRRQVEALQELGIELRSGEQRLHALQIAGVRTEALSELEEADGELQALAKRARSIVKGFKGIPAAPIPKVTAAFLRPYQRAGADFLVWAAKTFGGAVLADDMGLGKTLQVLSALAALKKEQKEPLPSLVVCPASVAHNWKREAARFTPELRVVVIERGMNRREVLERLDDYDLVIKNYALTRREADTLRAREWMAVCVDEAQAIKNPAADITRTVKSLPAKYRFTLTGTPIENRLTDLWSIVDFTIPSYLQSLKRFEQGLRDKDAPNFQRVVRARLRPVLLRRTKAEVAPELPPRIEERRDCEMPATQRKAYVTEVQKTRLLLDGLDPTGRKGAQGRIKMLAALTRLRQLCCDPALVGLPDKGSGKVEQLLELLPPILESGHKVLLFSQFVRMLKRLEKVLHGEKIRTRMLTGETNHRQELVDAFEADPDPSVFLISLKAGGVGLNLPSASHVILFDPWWNPAVEAQAIDRTHRIGQEKTVIAVRLVAAGTVEERILELQDRKRHLVTEMLEEEAFNRMLTKEDFAYLLETDA